MIGISRSTNHITKEWLTEQIKEYKSIREIALLGNCSTHTIDKKLIEFELLIDYINIKNTYLSNKKCIVCESQNNLQHINNEWYCGKHACQIKRTGTILKRTRFDEAHIIEYPDKGYAEIVIYNRKNIEVARAIIDIEDVMICNQYKWFLKDEKYVRTHMNINDKDKKVGLHRIIMNVVDNKNVVVDHIDRNPLNNRKSNLRVTTQAKNCINKARQSNNTSGIVGVTWRKENNKWEAQIKLNGKMIHLGLFLDKEDAIKKRLESEIIYFGEFAPQQHLFKKYDIAI